MVRISSLPSLRKCRRASSCALRARPRSGGNAASAAEAQHRYVCRTSPCRFFDANCELTYSFAGDDKTGRTPVAPASRASEEVCPVAIDVLDVRHGR